jgi:hypothetical protein
VLAPAIGSKADLLRSQPDLGSCEFDNFTWLVWARRDLVDRIGDRRSIWWRACRKRDHEAEHDDTDGPDAEPGVPRIE